MILLIGFTSSIPNLFAQHYKDSLDVELTESFNKSNIPGLYVMMLDRHGILYQKGLGYADIKNQKPFTAETIENIGSVSKTFIAIALMKAIELGYFTLETDINDILPFKIVNPNFPSDAIKVKHLGTHTSSILDVDSIYHKSYRFIRTDTTNNKVVAFLNELGYNGGLQDSTLATFLKSYLNRKGHLYSNHNFDNSKPGNRYVYSNIASALAAYLIEIKSGLSFSDFTQKNILKPLKMNRSTWFLNEVTIGDHAIPYFSKEMAFPFYSLTTYPDGGLRTSAADLGKFISEMMNGVNGQSHLLKKESFEKMITPNFSSKNAPDNLNLAIRNKGIFWNLYTTGYIGHDGDDPGVSANLLFNENIGIIFMANIYLDDRSGFLRILEKYAGKFTN